MIAWYYFLVILSTLRKIEKSFLMKKIGVFCLKIKTVFFVFIIAVINFCAAASRQALDFFSPQSRLRIEEIFQKPTPGEVSNQVTNFHSAMVAALGSEDFDEVANLFSQYESFIAYDLVIKDKRFYLSLFFHIFTLLCGREPFYNEHLNSFCSLVKTSTDKHLNERLFMLEFSFVDEQPEIDYVFSRKGTSFSLPVIKIICNPDGSLRKILVRGRTPHAGSSLTHKFFFYKEDVCPLFYEKNNYVRDVVSLLSHRIFHIGLFQTTLSEFYKKCPRRFLINKEKYFQALFILLATFVRSGVCAHEVVTAAGRSDAVFMADETVNVIEFKRNASPKKALEQIIAKGYCDKYARDSRLLRMIGINVDVVALEQGYDLLLAIEAKERLTSSTGFCWDDELPDFSEIRDVNATKKLNFS